MSNEFYKSFCERNHSSKIKKVKNLINLFNKRLETSSDVLDRIESKILFLNTQYDFQINTKCILLPNIIYNTISLIFVSIEKLNFLSVSILLINQTNYKDKLIQIKTLINLDLMTSYFLQHFFHFPFFFWIKVENKYFLY